MTADMAALQRVWLCAEGVGLVRADRVTCLVLNDGTVRGDDAEQAHEHDVLMAVLDGGAAKVVLASCGTSVGWKSLADLAQTIGRAAEAPARAHAVFVFASETSVRGIDWDHSTDRIDGHAWPAGPPRPRRPTGRRRNGGRAWARLPPAGRRSRWRTPRSASCRPAGRRPTRS